MLDRQQRHDLVVTQDHLALGGQHEPDVEEAAGELGMAGLGLAHQVGVPLPGQRAEEVGFRAGDVDGAFAGEGLVVQVEDLVVEPLQRAFWDGDQADRQVQAGQPGRGLDQVRQVLEVDTDVLAAADAAHRGNQAQGLIRLDQDRSFAIKTMLRLAP